MIIKSKEFKETCSTILQAIDYSELSTVTKTLSLRTAGRNLYLATTNKEYYCCVKFQLENEEDFNACVDANLFLNLIAAITTESIELTLDDSYVNVKGNGNYIIKLIFENDTLMEVPEIEIENEMLDMNIPGSVLESIVNYNTKQLGIGTISKPVQKMFYLDNEGCITYTTSGACINTFQLEKEVRVLFNTRLVNLFKLFKGQLVKFNLGYDPISETLIQTKVSFQTSNIKLVAITGCNDDLLSQIPVAAIRGRANCDYDNKVVFSVNDLKEAINRLLLFSAGYGSKENIKPYSVFDFSKENVVIFDTKKENTETLNYQNGTALGMEDSYTMTLDLIDCKKILDGCTEQYITLNFGNHKACVIARTSIKNVIAEIH